MNFEDINHAFGLEIMPGVAQLHYYIQQNHVTISEVDDTPANLAALVTLTDPFSVALGKKWYKMYSTLDSGVFGYSLQGADDSKTFLSWFEWKYPGTEAQAEGLISFWKHTPHYFVPVLGNGQRRLMGSKLWPCVLKKAEGTSGQKGSDYQGITLRVESVWTTPAPILADELEIQTTIEGGGPVD